MRLSDEKLRFLLNYGMLAPARGPARESQPWTIRASEIANATAALDLCIEHRCACPTQDGAHRELLIGAGVALSQLRLALRQLGLRDRVELFPEAARSELVARVHLIEDGGVPTPEKYVLFQALARKPDLGPPDDVAHAPASIAPELLAEIEAVSAVEGAVLRWVESEAFVSGEPLEPMPRSCDAPSASDIIAHLHPFRARSFDPQTSQWMEERDFSLRAPIVAVLATATDEPHDWIAAGQALGRLLLRARVDGLHASFREATAELERLRARLLRSDNARAKLCVPQLMFRLGYPERTEVVRLEIASYVLPPVVAVS